MEKFEIKVSARHFKRALSFNSNEHCPMAEALKEKFPNKDICVSVSSVRIDDVSYKLIGWTISDDVEETVTVNQIDEHIEMAKLGKRVPSYKVIVEKFKII